MKSTKISWIIASGFFSGYSPVAPGTVGSIAAVAAWYYCAQTAPHLLYQLPVLIVGLFVLGLVTTHFELQYTESDDPGYIVIDEWVGMLMPLLLADPSKPIEIFIAFAAFRFFDITKIEPARMCEKFSGAWGVMLDDVVAGAYAYALLWISLNFIPGMQ